MRTLLLCNPSNRRARFFQEALARAGHEPARVLAYADVLRAPGRLDDALVGCDALRIESPGEDAEVAHLLLRWGEQAPGEWPRAPRAHLEQEAAAFGEILYPSQRFAGFARLMHRVGEALTRHPGCRAMNSPTSILAMYDKRTSHQRFVEAGVPCPERLGAVSSYQELREEMARRGVWRVFVKLRWGSSASGVVAYMASPTRELATTSVELVHEGERWRLFNSLRIRRYSSRGEVAALLDAITAEGAVVERWVPKASVGGECFDVRVVCVAGQARQRVARVSRSPMTNLHLGNARGDLDALVERAPGGARALLARIEQRAGQAAGAFPGALYTGLDVMVAAGMREVMVLEANAFGDLIPGVTHRGQSSYEAEVEALERAVS